MAECGIKFSENKTKPVAQRHKMVSGSLALLYFPSFHGRKQGSGPNRGQIPVKWGDFPSVYLCVCPSPLRVIQPGLRPSHPGLKRSQPGLSTKISPVRAAALLPPKKTKKIPLKNKGRAGQGNRDLFFSFFIFKGGGDLLFVCPSVCTYVPPQARPDDHQFGPEGQSTWHEVQPA